VQLFRALLVVRKRLIAELLHLAEEIGLVDGQVFIIPTPTHSELASKIRTHRETVSRAISGLAKKELVEKRGGKLVLRDLTALEGRWEKGIAKRPRADQRYSFTPRLTKLAEYILQQRVAPWSPAQILTLRGTSRCNVEVAKVAR
jgi:hypothetical protein